MKSVEEVVACVIDYGTFISVAEKLADTMATVYYHSPYELEYQDVRDYSKGFGLDKVQKLDEPLDPDVLKSIDLFVFPDIGYGGLQRHLRSMGKAVWGHGGATDLELHRDLFLHILDQVGLPTVHSERLVGVTALGKYLKKYKNKWVKINRFRGNMDTWHHLDYDHSLRTLESLAVMFGGQRESVVFVVQDDIETDRESGYDGWCVDGNYPPYSWQGYEKKNELYLGSVMADADLPDEIKVVNEAMAPVLAAYEYRCWWATEIRSKDGVPYFIDPTPRMPGQTGEHQQETIKNFANIIWMGANGIIVKPDFEWRFAAEATLHYDSNTKDPTISDEWKTLHVPPEVGRWVKLYHYSRVDGVYHFGAKNTDEVGVVLGVGDSVQEAIEHVSANMKLLHDLPVHANTAGFLDLLKSIEEAEKEGIEFGGEIPEPEDIVDDIRG